MNSDTLPGPMLDNADAALFPKLTNHQIARLARHGKTRAIAAGEVLFRPGDTTYDVMVVLQGRVSVMIGSGDAARELAVQVPRDLIAELNILTGQSVAVTGEVREAGSVLVVPAEEFRALLGQEQEFGDFVLQMLFRRRKAIERLQLGIRIVGSRFDRDTHRLREFAARNRILHDWLDTDEPSAATLLQSLARDGAPGPVVFVGSDKVLRNPTNPELARTIGLRESQVPAEKACDLTVVGGGPAGLAAAVYGASDGLRTALVEAVAVGGQAATSARIENYLGFPAGLSGADLAERARLQAAKFGAHLMVPRRAVGLAERDGFYVVALDDGDELHSGSVILALGIQYRRLDIPRLADYEGLGIAYSVDSAREQLGPDDDVLIVGAANSAGQAALAFAEDSRRVRMVVRGDGLERSMSRYLRDRIAASPIEVLTRHEVRELAGATHLERVTVENVGTGEHRTLDAGALLVLIGAAPQTDWLAGAVALDEEGFVLTGPNLGSELRAGVAWAQLGRAPYLLETSRPGVFAVGDVRAGSTRRVAPAVGEGGMAARFVSEYLERTP